jgi:single-stranded-DNA-specific exonuclease
MNHSRWKLLTPLSGEQLSLMSQDSLPPLIAQLLYNRGVTDPADVQIFLDVDESLLHDPFLLLDMDKAVARIYHALLAGEKIAIFGDFDVDGITATTLLVEGLASLGANVVPYIPHRSDEGYGLNDPALARLRQEGVTLVVTVDCGISAAPEVETAKGIGLDIVVTDHHTVPSVLPQAVAAIDPKRANSIYPFADLAGVGVAFKLVQALFQYLGKDFDMAAFLDLVALGTVADMVSLLGENRYLVKQGLEVLHVTKRLGIVELARCAGVPLSAVDAELISWYLAPRLNAAGRLDHAGIGISLLSTDSQEQAHRLAVLLDKKNTERQKLTEDILAKAREQLGDVGPDVPLIMVGGEDFHSGVVGVVAGRLVEEYYRPVVVLEKGQEWSRGSARSIAGFDIIAAISECSDLLYRFGGHPMAAGFTVSTGHLNQLQEQLVTIAARQLSGDDLIPVIDIDAEVSLSSLRGGTFKMMQRLAPFGRSNPYPTFVARNVVVSDRRTVGNGGEHLKLKLKDDGVTWNGICFKKGHLVEEITPRLDIVFNLEVDQWSGGGMLQLNILDFAPAG